VFVGNDVGILGVPVGKVTSIVPEGDRVRVTLEVGTDHPVPARVAAVVVPRSVATDRYIELTPAYTSGPRLADGSVIPLARTRTPVEFDEVLKSLSGLAEGLSGQDSTRGAIRRLLDVSAKALRGRGALVNRTITSFAAATNGITAQRGKATATLRSLDGLTGALATNQDTVRRFVRQVSEASSLLAAERDSFRSALRHVTRMIEVVARFARENRSELTRTTRATTHTMHTVLGERKSVQELLSVMPLAVENLQRTMTPDHRMLVRLDITALLPILGPLLVRLCSAAPGDLCSAIGLDPSQIGSVLGSLLGVGGRR
jgi:phospholipid/cholesterol/gamma-HCH transport system substrate-binding protein